MNCDCTIIIWCMVDLWMCIQLQRKCIVAWTPLENMEIQPVIFVCDSMLWVILLHSKRSYASFVSWFSCRTISLTLQPSDYVLTMNTFIFMFLCVWLYICNIHKHWFLCLCLSRNLWKHWSIWEGLQKRRNLKLCYLGIMILALAL